MDQWHDLLPVLAMQLVWTTVIIVVITAVVRAMLKREGDKLQQALRPIMERVEAMTYVASEQANLNADEINRVKAKQDSQTKVVINEVQQVPDKVVEKLPPGTGDSHHP